MRERGRRFKIGRERTVLERLLGRAAARPRVLVVDDMADCLDIMRFFLENAGCEVYSARDGVEALHRARELRPELVIMNLMMPRMDGLQALERLKGDAILSGSRVIMQSARDDDETREEAVRLGALDFIATPFSRERLLGAVERALKT